MGTQLGTNAPSLIAHGEADVRWLGLLIYHARLWTPLGGWRADQPHALEICYARSIRGEQLAERSLAEMQHIGAGTEAERSEWLGAMRRIFPNVRDGDQLIALATPGGPTRFFFQ